MEHERSPIDKKMTEQLDLNIKNVHPSYEKFSDKGNRFIDRLQELGIARFYFGYAWENDESHCRHISYDLVGDKITPISEHYGNPGKHADERQITDGTEWSTQDWTQIIYEAFEDEASDDHMYVIDVQNRTVRSMYALYVTEPRLIDESNNEVTWNAY